MAEERTPLRRLKDLGKTVLPASWIYFYHSARAALKLGIIPEMLGTLRNRHEVVRLGGEAGWNVPRSRLTSESVCYCLGCGEDITFDLALIDRVGCEIYAFDPTPGAVAHVRANAGMNLRYHLAEVAIWDATDVVRFYVPIEGVSHSITNIEKTTEFIEVPARRLRDVMRDNGHDHVSLLKMDIEGAEHTVIGTILKDKLSVDILCVEFDGLAKSTPAAIAETKATVAALLAGGYYYFWIEGSNFTFVRS